MEGSTFVAYVWAEISRDEKQTQKQQRQQRCLNQKIRGYQKMQLCHFAIWGWEKEGMNIFAHSILGENGTFKEQDPFGDENYIQNTKLAVLSFCTFQCYMYQS